MTQRQDQPDFASFHGDRPIRDESGDRLGFGPLAGNIATALLADTLKEGMVVGIEGKWGSGKSSLVNLIERELEKKRENGAPPYSLLRFQPWLIGNRDALIGELFVELEKELKRLETKHPNLKDRIFRLLQALQRYSSTLLRGTGKLIEHGGALLQLGGTTAVDPRTAVVGFSLQKAGGFIQKWRRKKEETASLSLAEQKENVESALRDLGHRFIVVIDDLDRLEPSELMEVLRLVRAVADLPNIVYLLCYDHDIVAHNVKHAIGVQNGHAYLKKIVQINIPIPQPETFKLSMWLGQELRKFTLTYSINLNFRLLNVIGIEGLVHLHTPRDINMVLDALRFTWPALRRYNIDFIDLVWIQLIRITNRLLYEWIENYCNIANTNIKTEGIYYEKLANKLSNDLLKLIPEDNVPYISNLLEFLPKTGFGYKNYVGNQPIKSEDLRSNIFLFTQDTSDHKIESDYHGRIKDPEYCRLYFAFGK